MDAEPFVEAQRAVLPLDVDANACIPSGRLVEQLPYEAVFT